MGKMALASFQNRRKRVEAKGGTGEPHGRHD